MLAALDGKKWTHKTARLSFPILVERAWLSKPLTYGELNRTLVSRRLGHSVFAANYGSVAGLIGNACREYSEENGAKVPPINLIVVNQNTGEPGEGAAAYIERFCKVFLGNSRRATSLSERERSAILEQARQEIFQFPDWEEVLAAYHLPQAKRPRRAGREIPPATTRGWHTGPESEAHKSLKAAISKKPSLVRAKCNGPGKEEFLLSSGDEVDVVFDEIALGVEVKAVGANEGEVARGVFQCVKYRAVMRAQQVANMMVPTADCVLAVGGNLSAPNRELARLLDVRFFDGLTARLRKQV